MPHTIHIQVWIDSPAPPSDDQMTPRELEAAVKKAIYRIGTISSAIEIGDIQVEADMDLEKLPFCGAVDLTESLQV